MRAEGWAKYNYTSTPNPKCGEYVLTKFNPSEPVVSANAAPSARKARTKTSAKAPGARAAKHSKAVVEEPVTAPSVAAPVIPAPVAPAPVAETVIDAPVKIVTREEIAKLAYCYWADRGYQDGNPEEDWARAEQALLSTAS
jgi:hypothetical protein